MSDLNIRFSNCFNFINNTKRYLEANPTDWRNVYTEEALTHAECDLMEMELETDYDAEEYDTLLNGNVFRTAKKANRRKQNKKNKNRDRIHGRRHGGAHGGVDFRYVDCNPFCNKHQYVDAMFYTNGKHGYNSTRKASAMDAREQEYYSTVYLTKETKEAKVSAETTEEEAGNFDDFLWYLVEELPEQKYVVLFSFDNGQSYEDRDGCTNEFRGVMTKDEVIAELTKAFLWNDDGEIKISETEITGLKGARFNWDFGHDEWGWNGYESFTIIPVSRLI